MGFLIPQGYVEILDWETKGGHIDTEWLSLTQANIRRRKIAYFLCNIETFLWRLSWRLFRWRGTRIVPFRFLKWHVETITTWTDGNGNIDRVNRKWSIDTPYYEKQRQRIVVKRIDDNNNYGVLLNFD